MPWRREMKYVDHKYQDKSLFEGTEENFIVFTQSISRFFQILKNYLNIRLVPVKMTATGQSYCGK